MAKKSQMDREDAIEYLQKKGYIKEDKIIKPKFNKSEEADIRKVMSEGKIYSDPICEFTG